MLHGGRKKKKNYLSREQGKMADILTDCRMTISRKIEQFPPPSFLFHHFNDDHSIDEDDFTRCRNRTNENTRNSPKINFCSGGIFFFFFFTPLNQLTFKIDYFILHLVLMKKIFVEIWHGKRYAEREMTRETNGNYFSIRLSGASNNYLFLYLLGILYIYIG